jgi:hypothetical protein
VRYIHGFLTPVVGYATGTPFTEGVRSMFGTWAVGYLVVAALRHPPRVLLQQLIRALDQKRKQRQSELVRENTG